MKKILLFLCVAILVVTGCSDGKAKKKANTLQNNTSSKAVADFKSQAVEAIKRVLDYEFSGDGEAFINAAYPDKAIEQMLCGTQYTKETLIKNMNRNFEYIKGASYSDFKVVSCEFVEGSDLIAFDFEYGILPEICYKMTVTYACKFPNDQESSVEENVFLAYKYYDKWYAFTE